MHAYYFLKNAALLLNLCGFMWQYRLQNYNCNHFASITNTGELLHFK